MSSFDRLDLLREQNKSLLAQLNDLRGRRPNLNVGPSGPRIACLSETSLQTPQQAGPHPGVSKTASLTPSGSQEGTALHVSGDQAESPASIESVSVVTLPGGELGQARAALSRPRAPLTTERLASRTDRDQEEALATETDLFRRTTPLLHFGSQDTQSRGSPGYSERLQDEGNRRLAQAWQAGPKRPKSTPSFQDRDQREMIQMTFEELDQDQDEERHRLRPLLGYDWIAGLLDAETSMTERSEQFFTELRNFRKVNREECIHSQIPGAGKDDFSPPEMSVPLEKRTSQLPQDSHQCTFCYRINSRLFPSPLDPQTACPVCKVPKSHYPNSETAFIRVSIPRSTLLPAHRYKAHRRRSFNPSDSLSLPSHCMTGWSSIAPAEAPQLSSLDLRSCLTTTHTTSGPAAQPDTNLMQQSTAKPKQQLDVISGVAVSQHSEELIDASRLARYRFQRLTPNQIKPHSTAYPIF